MRNVFRVSCASFLLMCSVFIGSPAWAEDERYPDTFKLRLGGYHVKNADFIGRLDANNAPVGAYIDFRDTLGGEERATVFRLDGHYRFNERHALGFAWYDVKFNGSKVLEVDFTWNGNPYTIGTQIDSELKFDVIKLNYQYSLYHNEEVELGASFGFHIMKTFASIDAAGIGKADNVAVTAPLPVLGLFVDHKFNPRFSAFYSIEFFFINYEDRFRGALLDMLIGLEYRVTRHFGLGASYNMFSLNAKAKGDNATLFLDGSWTGGMLFGSLYF